MNMKTNPKYDNFSKAMGTILKANPAVVKSAMEAEKKERAAERKAKRSSAARASSAKG